MKGKSKRPTTTTPAVTGSSNNSSSKAKSKAAKEHVVKVKEFMPTMEFIAQIKEIKVIIPLNIIRTFKSRITARGVTGRWYEANQLYDSADNEAREHLVDILRQALRVLVPVAKLQQLDKLQFKLSEVNAAGTNTDSDQSSN